MAKSLSVLPPVFKVKIHDKRCDVFIGLNMCVLLQRLRRIADLLREVQSYLGNYKVNEGDTK